VELVRKLDADLIDGPYMLSHHPTRLARFVAQRVGIQAGQLVEVFLRQKEYEHILVWSDRLGILLAMLFKLARMRRDVVVLTSYLASPRRARVLRYLRVDSHMGAIICDGSKQVEVLNTRFGIPNDKLHLALQGVDEQFWHSLDLPIENMICSVGQQDRDYPTLVAAVRGLDLRVELVLGGVDAAVQTPSAIIGADVPSNVHIRTTCSKRELRELCARARFVVIPTQDVDFAAGSTALKEAMAMGKAVIVTRSHGQIDYVRDGYNGIYVPPGDPAAFRTAIEYLVNHPDEAERMGRAGQAMVEEQVTMDAYTAHLAAILTRQEVSVQSKESLADIQSQFAYTVSWVKDDRSFKDDNQT
jgi:glycosyltransferase involved in cell wall biosynthesis